jgi:hypothetical protein
MNPIDNHQIEIHVNETIEDFHNKRLAAVSKLDLQDLIKKNPYLFRAKNTSTASQLIESTMSAFLSSSEEKIFGDFLEDLAIFIAGKTCNGRKSSSQGIDLELELDGVTNIISIKSGPNWGNSSQHLKLAQDFKAAEIRLKQSKLVRNVQAVLGICYGNTRTTYAKEGYLKVVGQNFWTLISDDRELYTEIIEPIGYRAKEHNDRYEWEKARITNLLTKRFIDNYCFPSGEIDWKKVVTKNSGNFDLDQI